MPNRNGDSVRLLSGLEELCHALDLVICDLWGVMHNGESPYLSAIDAIEKARRTGVQTVFLSNAPRPREHIRHHLIEMGMPKHITDNVVTSGGLARDEVREEFQDAKLYHLGPETDLNTIEGLPVRLVDHPDDAEVIVATGLDFPRVEGHRALLAGAAARNVPFLCANPDRVVHVGEKLYFCAGSVADLYETMGGEVHWFGKPTRFALLSCLKEIGMPADTAGDRIVMIGDSLQTDMAGAAAAGFMGLFIAGGIHRHEYPALLSAVEEDSVPVKVFQKIFGAGKAVPHAAMKQLVW